MVAHSLSQSGEPGELDDRSAQAQGTRADQEGDVGSANPIVGPLVRANVVTASHEERGPTSPDLIASRTEAAERKRNAARDLPSEYRSGVGVMLLNSCNKVLVGRRRTIEGEAWQMPQGGIDEGENPREAVYRELKEEIGTDNVEILERRSFKLVPGRRFRLLFLQACSPDQMIPSDRDLL